MLYPPHVRRFIIRPALARLPEEMRSEAAVALLLGTALTESRLIYLRQGVRTVNDGNGAAMGPFQMEEPTYHDVWRYIGRHSEWADAVGPKRPPEAMMSDFGYATIIARLNYYRKPRKLPAVDDLEGLASYWKAFWNTSAGAGSPQDFIKAYTPWAPRKA